MSEEVNPDEFAEDIKQALVISLLSLLYRYRKKS